MTQSEIIYRNFAKQFNYDYGYTNNTVYPIGTMYLRVWKKGLYGLDKAEWEKNSLMLRGEDLNCLFEKAFKQFGFG